MTVRRRFTFQVEPGYEGYTLEDFLSLQLPQFTSSTIRKMGYDKIVQINSEKASLGQRLVTGDHIQLVLPQNAQNEYKTRPINLEILYENKELLIVDKPSGIPVIKEKWSREHVFRDSIQNYLHNKGEKNCEIRVLHNVDKDMSGAILVAKSKNTEQKLKRIFENEKIHTRYLVLVAGTPPKTGIIEAAITQASPKSARMEVSDSGKKYTTKYNVLEVFRDFSLLEVEIGLGRVHQIRVHLASVGHPLAIDDVYGYRNCLKVSDIKDRYIAKKKAVEKPIISRIPLHAHKVCIEMGSDPIVVECPLAKDFLTLLKKLRKYRS